MRFILLFVLFLTGLTLSAQTWHKLFFENNISPGNITGIASDMNGDTWIATQSNGAYRYNGIGLIQYTTANGLQSNQCRAITSDSYGRIWIGSNLGLVCWNNGAISSYNTQSGMQGQNVYSLCEGANGIVWIGTSVGLIRFDGNAFIQYTTANGLPSNIIRALAFDGTNVWIGTTYGLSKFDGIAFQNYTVAEGLPSNNIKSLYGVSQNEVWVGTFFGAALFNGSGFQIYNHTNGLVCDTVLSFTKDQGGNIWFCTPLAVTRMNGTVFTHFDKIDYDINNYFNTKPNCIYALNNDIFIGTDNECIKIKRWMVKNPKLSLLQTDNISAQIASGGALLSFNDTNALGLEFPKNTGMFTIFNSNLWVGGLDPAQNLHLAAVSYYGTDFFSGPHMEPAGYTEEYDSLYNRLWAISKAEVDYHIANWNQLGYQMPEVIKNWPAISAPYDDLNDNAVYEPDQGEYPLIRGDRSVFCVYNDNRYTHASSGEKLSFEVTLLYYVYDDADEYIQNTIFVNANIINRNIYRFDNVYIGIQSDIDIGVPTDDYLGCDSTLSCYFGYNATATDNQYQNNIPAQGIVFLSSPIYSFNYYTNTTNLVLSDPQIPWDYYYNLSGFWKDGSPYTYGGNGYGGTSATRYVFSGDPAAGTGWSEVSEANTPGDRRAIGSIGPFSIDPGKSKCIDFAYVTGRDSSGNNLLSVNAVKSHAADIIQFYNNSSFFCDTIFVSIPTDIDINAMPVYTCRNAPVELHPVVNGYHWPMTYIWSPTAGLSDSTIANPVATVDTTTTFFVTVTDAQGNSVTDSLVVFVTNPTLTMDTLYEMCSGGVITLPPASLYWWSTLNTISQWNYFYTSGNYWAMIRNEYGCWSDTAFFTVNVTPAPQPELGPTITLCNDATTILQPGAFISFLWSTGSTGSSLFVDGNTMTPANYLFSVTVTDATGCTGSDLVVVKVIDCLGNEINDQQEALYAYPNPFNDVIKIVTSENDKGPFTIELLDATGRLVMSRTENVPEIKTSGLRPGFYTLRFSSESGRNVFRLVKTE